MPEKNGVKPQFRDDYIEVVQRELTRVRSAPGVPEIHFDVLSPPHVLSPFLTLAERRGEGLPSHVVKVLLIPGGGGEGWMEVLTKERDRLEREIQVRLVPNQTILRLPLSRLPTADEQLVEVRRLDRLRQRDLLTNARGAPTESVILPYLVRPFIAWPSLQEAGYSHAVMEERWKEFCNKHGLKHIHNNEKCKAQFYQEALVDGGKELIVVSAWRWQRARGDFSSSV
jgi:hypothetical protein